MAQSTYQQVNAEPGKTTLLIQPHAWTIVSVSCDTVGPALVGSSSDLKPGTGQGVVLTDVPRYLYLEPGDTLYVYAPGTDVINIATHPMTWLGELIRGLQALVPAGQRPTRGVEVPYPKMPAFPTNPIATKKGR